MTHQSQDNGTKSILITGVSSGIGLGMTKKFLKEGYHVFGSVRSKEKASELRSVLGENFSPLIFDICEPEELLAAEQTLQSTLQKRHLVALINNAGSAEIGPLLHVPPEDLQRQLNTLVVGQLRVIQSFYKHLLPSHAPPGRIINISSISGVGVNYFFGGYAAGKHALEGLSKTLRIELRSLGIKVIVVAPGNIATDIWPKQTRAAVEKYRNTSYFSSLQQSVQAMTSGAPRDAMSVDDFSTALFEIFGEVDPAERYTVRISKRRRIPFSRARLRILRG